MREELTTTAVIMVFFLALSVGFFINAVKQNKRGELAATTILTMAGCAFLAIASVAAFKVVWYLI